VSEGGLKAEEEEEEEEEAEGEEMIGRNGTGGCWLVDRLLYEGVG